MKRAMKKVFLLLLIGILLLGAAQAAENKFSCDEFSVVLNKNMKIASEEELMGYEAAVSADYPGAGETKLFAADKSREMMAYFAITDSDLTARDAAAEAANTLLGSDGAMSEYRMGKNDLFGFACTVDDTQMDIYYMKIDGGLLVIHVAGMDADQITDMLSSIET